MVRGLSGASTVPECRTARTRCTSSSPALPTRTKAQDIASSTPAIQTGSKTFPGLSKDKTPPSVGSAELSTPHPDCNIRTGHISDSPPARSVRGSQERLQCRRGAHPGRRDDRFARRQDLALDNAETWGE